MQGLSHAVRLIKTDDFSSVFAFRKNVRSKHFCLHLRPNHLDTARLGIATPKKFLRFAVARNTVRRIGRESFRSARVSLAFRDLVLRVARPIAYPLDKAAIRAEIDQLLERVAA